MKSPGFHIHTAPNGKQYLIKTGPRGTRRNMGEVEDADHVLQVVTAMQNNLLAHKRKKQQELPF